jgi:cyclopropane fatty-acyl-phospholipid synthase-like methyltransferase
VTTDSITAYETHAQQFLRYRDRSEAGIQVVSTWANSLTPNADVLEIACGGGIPITRTLVDTGVNIWAIDASPTLMAVFKGRFPDIPAECVTVLESSYFQRKYDAAIAIGLIFLLGENDQLKMLERVSGILRPGASFLFTAPLETGTWADNITGHTCISLGRDAYETALAQAGFRVVRCHEDTGRNNYYEAEKIR